MAFDDWIDLPKGLAGGSALAAMMILGDGVVDVSTGQRIGWVLIPVGLGVAALSWRLMANYIRGGRSDSVPALPRDDVEPLEELGSNVRRLD
jgi:hypothetical protein